MKRRLFLTGPIGCGKSTAIYTALGDKISQCGGFLTRRHHLPHLHFTLQTPDGSQRAAFLSFPEGKPEIDWDVFPTLGAAAIRLPEDCRVPVILDEIGGIELLCPEFFDALRQLLSADVPILGVIKSDTAPLIRALGLTEGYEAALQHLRALLARDENTLIHTCCKFDETALILARNWVKEYCP